METHDLTRDVWAVDAEAFPSSAPVEERARFLLRYAILAPSSHNSQPWRFAVHGRDVHVAADESRWLTVADPGRRELHLSVGCAVENLRVAAERFGFDPRVEYRVDDHLGAVVTLRDGDGGPLVAPRSDLFDAITERYTSHAPFEDRPVAGRTLDRFQAVLDDGVSLRSVDDPDLKRALGDLEAEADERLMSDADYRAELGRWVGSGALGHSWLGARIGQAVVTYLDLGDREGRKNATLVREAPAVGVLVTPSDDPVAQARAGQAFERLALVATAEGVAVHPISQTLERPDLRERLADLLDVGDGVPQHLFRVGHVDETGEHTPRWPLEAFLPDGS